MGSIIEEFILPKRWYIYTEDKEKFTILVKHIQDNFCWRHNTGLNYYSETGFYSKKPSGHTEITFEQFEKYVLKNKKEKIESILDEAKRKYPKGTKYIGIVNGRECEVIEDYRIRKKGHLGNYKDGVVGIEAGADYIYMGGRWAELVSKSKPKEEPIYDLSTVITRAVKANDPRIISKETGKTIEELCDKMVDIGSCKRGDWATWFNEDVLCRGLSCSDCIFNKSMKKVQAWLRQGSKDKFVAGIDIASEDSKSITVSKVSGGYSRPDDESFKRSMEEMRKYMADTICQSVKIHISLFGYSSEFKKSYEDKDGILITDIGEPKEIGIIEPEILKEDKITEI